MSDSLSFDDLIPASQPDESDLSFDDLIPEQQPADAELSFDDLVPASPVMPAPAAEPQPVDMQGRIRELLEQEGQYQTALGDYNNQYQQWEQGFMDQRAFNPAAIPDAQPEQPVIPVRDQAQLLADFKQGIPFVRPQELAQLINGIELGRVSPEQSQAIRQLLSTQLGSQGERAFDMAEITRGLYQQQLAEKAELGGVERRADVLGRDLAKSATLGYAYSADEDRLNSEDLHEAAAERALQLIRDSEAEKYWGSSITGNMAGFMVPYAGAVKLLRMGRVAKGLAPVEAGITGAMKEGAIAGSAVDLLTRPEGAESMGAAENVIARVAQAGIGASIGAVADAGLLKLTDWISFRMQARKDKKLQQQIKKEATEAGYENPDDYLDSLIELVDTENGTAIRGRTDLMDNLPEVDEVPAGPAEQFVPGMAQQADQAANPLQAEPVDQAGSVSAIKPPLSTVTTIRGTPVEVDYQVVDADDLVTSHLGNGVVNPDHPADLFGAAPASKQDFITTTNRNLETRYGEDSPAIPSVRQKQARQKTGEADPELSGETLQGNRSGQSTGNGRARTASVAESGVRESGTVEKAEVFSQGNIKQDGLTELGRTVRHVETATLPTGIKTVSTAGDVAHVTAPYRKEAQETFLTVITDDAGKVLRVARLHTGGKAGAAVEPATVAGVATNTPGAKKAWFVHNHPSGDVTQSAADKQLTARLDDLLDGSGIESGGMVTIGPDAKYSYHQPTDRQGFTPNDRAYDELDMDGELAQPIPAKARRESVPVTERRLAGKGNSTQQSITSGDQVEQYFAANPDQKEGIVLLDTMKRPVGWLPMSRDEMTRMRNGKGGGSGKLLRAIDRTNATAIAARVDSGRVPDLNQVAGNLDGFSKVAGVELVDVANQAGQALGKRQDLPSQSTFYSNPINIAAREIAKDLGLEQGVAAAGGAVYGGVSSDEELGSAKWWLDVAAGAGVAATVSAGLKGAGLTSKDGFLSRHLSRLGNAIDELPLIGRGNTEVRELKQRQKLMKQILDRQTEEMGTELLKRFTPSERAMMSDLIENKGIIKDYNLIHRQAAELDEFISYTSEKMKELGMLPAELETGGYLHRYYSKHLKIGDKLFKGAKKQSMSGSYSIARGTDDTFAPEYLSGDARRLMGELDTLNTEIKKLEAKQHDLLDTDTQLKLADLKEQRRELQETKLREYIGMENGKPQSFIFTEHEAVDTAGQSMPRGDLVPAGDVRSHQFEATDRAWSARGMVNGKAMLHRDWTKAERQSWGEIEDAGYRFVRGQAEVAHDLSLATFFKKVADNSDWVSETDPGGWHYVSDQKVGKNSPLKKYGALAGKYVDPKIWAAVRHHGRAPFGSGKIATTYRGLLNRWKLYKTVYNPVTHFNNTWSNTEMYFMGGYEAKHIASAIKALRGKEGSELWKDARDSGLFGQDWSNSILQSNEGGGNSVLEGLAEKLRTQPEIPDAMEVTDAVMRFKEWWINSKQAVKDADTKLKTGLAVAKAVGQPASMLVRKPLKAATQSAQKLYQLEDELFKLAAFAQERAAGATKRDAVNAANRFFFDYNDLPEGVKIVRDFPIGSPFISYSYLALPAIVKTAVEKPERLLALAAMYEAVNYAGMTVNDDLEAGEYWQRMSDEDTLSAHWNKGRALWGARNAISVPYLEGYRVSFANAHALGNPFAGESGDRQFAIPGPLQSFWGSDIFGGNPFRALLDIVGNEDWKGKEIVSPEASDEERYKAYAAYLYQAWAPSNPLTPGSYHQEKIIEGLANDVNQARAKGEKASGLAEGVVDMANGVTSALGFEQFTGVNGSGNEILTRDSALGSVGIKLRPMRPDQFMQFEIQDITAKQKKLDGDLRKLSVRYGEGKVTEKQLAEKQAFHQKQTEKNTKELQELIDAWNGLQRK